MQIYDEIPTYMALTAHGAPYCDPRSEPRARPLPSPLHPHQHRAVVLSATQRERRDPATFDPRTRRGWRAAPAKGSWGAKAAVSSDTEAQGRGEGRLPGKPDDARTLHQSLCCECRTRRRGRRSHRQPSGRASCPSLRRGDHGHFVGLHVEPFAGLREACFEGISSQLIVRNRRQSLMVRWRYKLLLANLAEYAGLADTPKVGPPKKFWRIFEKMAMNEGSPSKVRDI